MADPLSRTLSAKEVHFLVGNLILSSRTSMSIARALEVSAESPELASIAGPLSKAAVMTAEGQSLPLALRAGLGDCAGPLFHGLIAVWDETRSQGALEALDRAYASLWTFSSRLRAQLVFPMLGGFLLLAAAVVLRPALLPFALALAALPIAWRLLVPVRTRSALFIGTMPLVPVAGGAYRRLVGSMFLSCFCSVTEAGLGISAARRVLVQAFPHGFLKQDIENAFRAMERGGGIGDAFGKAGFLTSAEKASIGIGAESGALGKTLERMAKHAEIEVDNTMEVTLRLTAQALSLLGSLLTGLAVYSIITGNRGAIISKFGG